MNLKSFLISASLLIITLEVNSQHCALHNSSILLLEVTSKSDTVIIPNLRITLLDSLGNPVFFNKWRDISDTFSKDSIRLKQCIDSSFHDVNFQFYCQNFPNIIYDNYMLWQNVEIKGMQLLIVDVDSTMNRGHFVSTIVKLQEKNLKPLCNHYWDDENAFEPVKIKLDKY